MKAEKLIINGEEQELFDWSYSSLDGKPTLGTAASKDVGTNAGNVPILDANGKLDSNIVPSTGVMTSYTVTNKSDLTTLTTAVKGDIGIVTSENKTYILSNDPYSTLSNWTELLFPTGSVSSVNGFTGAVNLTTGYIQESNNNLFTSPTEKATWNNKLGANNVSTVALTGNYGDLNSKPVIDTAMSSSSTNAVQNKIIKAYVDTTAGSSAAGVISDTAYGSSWDGDTTHAPSKNAVYDEVQTVLTSISNIEGNITTIQGNLNTKTFYLSSNQDLTNAQAAYDWYKSGKNPILVWSNQAYSLRNASSSSVEFVAPSRAGTGNSYTVLTTPKLTLLISGTTVTSIDTIHEDLGGYLDISSTYSTPYTPLYNGSPATKKYVDDSVANLGGLKFQVITQSAYTALNGTYAPNTVYLIKQG